MYVIANVSGKEIIISDLKLTIAPHRACDLHCLNLSLKPEKSKDLEICKKKGMVRLIKYDADEANVSIQPVTKIAEEPKTPTLTKEEVANIIKSEIGKLGNNNNEEVLKMLQMINQSIQDKSQKVQYVQTQNGSQVVNKEEEMDEDTLVKMHEKTMERLSKSVDKHIDSGSEKVETVKADKMQQDLSELENLLG